MTDAYLPANFDRVNNLIFRGARPASTSQIEHLYDLGVRTMLNLEWEQSDYPIARNFHLINFVRVKDFEPLPFFAPSIEDRHVVSALQQIDTNPGIIYVHCRSGQNRTGVIIAAYRIIVEATMRYDDVLAEFNRFKGFWSWFDQGYIRSFLDRRAQFIIRVADARIDLPGEP